MAILKKKMAGKPAMMKKSPMRKAQDGDEVKFNKKTGEQTNKNLAEVTTRPGFGKNLKNNVEKFIKGDPLQADSAKTKVGKILRKAGNTAIKVASAPAAAIGIPMQSATQTAVNAVKDKKSLNAIAKKKMGGKVAKKMAPKMMMKKMSKKK
jgi:hypothetical protein